MVLYQHDQNGRPTAHTFVNCKNVPVYFNLGKHSGVPLVTALLVISIHVNSSRLQRKAQVIEQVANLLRGLSELELKFNRTKLKGARLPPRLFALVDEADDILKPSTNRQNYPAIKSFAIQHQQSSSDVEAILRCYSLPTSETGRELFEDEDRIDTFVSDVRRAYEGVNQEYIDFIKNLVDPLIRDLGGINRNQDGLPCPLFSSDTRNKTLIKLAILVACRVTTTCDKTKIKRCKIKTKIDVGAIVALVLAMWCLCSGQSGSRDILSGLPFDITSAPYHPLRPSFCAHICHSLRFGILESLQDLKSKCKPESSSKSVIF